MNKNKNNNEFSIRKINNIINKINKSGLILIVVCYILILSIALSMVGKEISYVNQPNYQHQFYNNDINPQISIVGVRDYEEEHGHMRLKYSISVNISGRYVENKDPKYKIPEFRMFASTKTNLTDKEPNSTYYFTEHTTYSTPITHSFSVDNHDKGQHPSTFYVSLEYVKNDVTKITTFKEDVFLQPTKDDIAGMDDWYYTNQSTAPSAANVKKDDHSNPVGIFEIQAYEEENDGVKTGNIKSGIRIRITDQEVNKFHIDMQSWIITEDGEYLPFIGVYNYTGPSLRYTNSEKNIHKKLDPEYIGAKIVFKDDLGNEYTSYFKQKLDLINDTFLTDTQIGVDAGNIIRSNKGLYIMLAIVSSIALAVAVVGCTYIVTNSKKTKEN